MKRRTIDDIRKKANGFLHPLGYFARVDKLFDEILIEPCTFKTGNNRKDFFDGMQITIFPDGVYEVSEYMAGQDQDELHIFKEARSLKAALKNMIKGNKRSPEKIKKIWK